MGAPGEDVEDVEGAEGVDCLEAGEEGYCEFRGGEGCYGFGYSRNLESLDLGDRRES